MKYNRLGNTGLKVSELCLGTMTFGRKGIWTAIGTLEQPTVEELRRTAVGRNQFQEYPAWMLERQGADRRAQ